MKHPFIDGVCLLCACGAAALACAGAARAAGALAKLHYVALASMVTPICVAAAVWVEDGLGAAAIKATVVAILLAAESPLIAHVTGRAIFFRDRAGDPPKRLNR